MVRLAFNLLLTNTFRPVHTFSHSVSPPFYRSPRILLTFARIPAYVDLSNATHVMRVAKDSDRKASSEDKKQVEFEKGMIHGS